MHEPPFALTCARLLQITRKVACRMTPLQLQLYADVLAKDWDRVNAMGELALSWRWR